jgi:hypothetical protein
MLKEALNTDTKVKEFSMSYLRFFPVGYRSDKSKVNSKEYSALAVHKLLIVCFCVRAMIRST